MVPRRALMLVVVGLGIAILPSLGEEKTPPSTQVAKLEWLTGRWQVTSGTSVWEEHWMAPRGDSIVALTRWVKDGRLRLVEVTSIEQGEDATVLRLRHFNPGLVPWASQKDGPEAWRLVRLGDREAVFENPAQSFPRRIVYRRPDDDHLEARLEGKGPDGPRVQRFLFERVKR